MPIHVTCSGCLKRFTVPNRFAGKRGPCPHCETVILVPNLEDEVVIEEPAEAHARSTGGRSVLKPLVRESREFSRFQMVVVGMGILFTTLIAFVIRLTVNNPDEFPPGILALGAVLLSYPASIGGYIFLRDDELGTFYRSSMLIRTGICAATYCLVFGIYAFLPGFMERADSPTIHIIVGTICLLLASIAPWAALDFDYTNGLLHCGFYVVVAVALCFVMGTHQLLWVTPS